MAVAWYLAPLVREPADPDAPKGIRRVRMLPAHLAVDDLIAADGGRSAWTEVLGQYVIVKVRASATTLSAIAALPNVTRLPASRLDEPLSSLGTAQKTAMRTLVRDRGYTLAEVQARFPDDLGTYTLRELLRFIATRRRKVRYDADTDTVIDDGDLQPVRPIEDVDAEVEDTLAAVRRA